MVSDIVILLNNFAYLCSQFLTILHAICVVLWWLVSRLVIEPVEGLVSNCFLHHQPILTFADVEE